jgi:hypothetical protein
LACLLEDFAGRRSLTRGEVGAYWRSSSEQLYQKTHPGDVIWVVVSSGVSNETQWCLLECFSPIKKETLDEAAKRYKYLFVGDKDSHTQ